MNTFFMILAGGAIAYLEILYLRRSLNRKSATNTVATGLATKNNCTNYDSNFDGSLTDDDDGPSFNIANGSVMMGGIGGLDIDGNSYGISGDSFGVDPLE